MHQIGVGVLGPVFRTYEPSEDRLVAVKAFHLDITPEQTQTLVDALTRVIEADLSHPGIVAPIDVGLEDGVPYMAQEYVAAESLDVAMRHYAPAPVETAMPFIRQIGEAIDEAHQRGVVHGSLHLRDVFLTPDDVRITGFGVVKALEELRLAGPIRRPYTAPEVISGIGWGSEADLFALAAVAYELLTGRRAAGTGEQVTERLNAVDNVADGEALQVVFATALSDSRDDRYSSAARFVSSLESAIGHEGSGAAKISDAEAPESSLQPPDLLAGLDLYQDEDVLPSRSDLAEKRTADPIPPVAPPSFESFVAAADADVADVDVHEDEGQDIAEDHGDEPERAVEVDAFRVEADPFDSESFADEVSAVDDVLGTDEDDDVPVADTPEPLSASSDLLASDVIDPTDVTDTIDVSAKNEDEGEDEEAEEEADETVLVSAPLDRDDGDDLGDRGALEEEEDELDDQDELDETEAVRAPVMGFSDEAPTLEPVQREYVADAGSQRDDEFEAVPFAPSRSLPPEVDDEPAYFVPPAGAERPSWVSRGAVPLIGVALAIGAVAYLVSVGLGRDDGPTDQVLGEQGAGDAASLEFSEEVVNAGQPGGGDGRSESTVASSPSPSPAPAPTPPPAAVSAPTPPPRAPPSAPAPPTAAPISGSGWLLVRTVPAGAAVTVDGVSRGETPLSLEDVAYGEHEVGVGLTGFGSESQRVTISATETVATVGLALTPTRDLGTRPGAAETGSLDVESRPAGARIMVDGELAGTTPTRLDLPVGRHVVRIELDGYQAWSKAVVVIDDEGERVAASLDRTR